MQVTNENGEQEKLIVKEIHDKYYIAVDKQGSTREVSTNEKTDYNYTNIGNKNTTEFLNNYNSDPKTPIDVIVKQAEQNYEHNIVNKVLDQAHEQLSNLDPNLSQALNNGNLIQLNGNKENIESLKSLDNLENKTLILNINNQEHNPINDKEFLSKLDNFTNIIVVTDSKDNFEKTIYSSMQLHVKLQDYDVSQARK